MNREPSEAEMKWIEKHMGDCLEYGGEEMMLGATNVRWAVLENAQGETGRVLVEHLMREEQAR